MATLRAAELGTDPALPGAAGLAVLVDDYRRAGLDIAYAVDGDLADLDGPVGTALHRSPEALTNVARHAPGNQVDVSLVATGEEVRLQIVDSGGGRAASPRPAPLRAGRHGRTGPGRRGRAGLGALRGRLAGRGPAAGAPPGGGSPVIRVIIVDDQAVVRAGVARILGPDDGFAVVAECEDGDEVVAAVAEHRRTSC